MHLHIAFCREYGQFCEKIAVGGYVVLYFAVIYAADTSLGLAVRIHDAHDDACRLAVKRIGNDSEILQVPVRGEFCGENHRIVAPDDAFGAKA